MSDLGDPYGEGFEAFLGGKSEAANPYETDDTSNEEAARSWNDGWNAAADEDGLTD